MDSWVLVFVLWFDWTKMQCSFGELPFSQIRETENIWFQEMAGQSFITHSLVFCWVGSFSIFKKWDTTRADGHLSSDRLQANLRPFVVSDWECCEFATSAMTVPLCSMPGECNDNCRWKERIPIHTHLFVLPSNRTSIEHGLLENLPSICSGFPS